MRVRQLAIVLYHYMSRLLHKLFAKIIYQRSRICLPIHYRVNVLATNTTLIIVVYLLTRDRQSVVQSQWSNSIYDRGCARAIPDHVMKVTDRESAKISNRIQSLTTMIDCFFDTCASPRFKSSTSKIARATRAHPRS